MERRWGHTEELLATLVELVHALYRVQLKSPWFKQGRDVEPLRWPRPGRPVEKPRQLKPSEFIRAIAVGGN